MLPLARAGAQDREHLITRAIPSSGERVPAVGLGTAQSSTAWRATRQAGAGAVVAALIAAGGRLIDTASSYGDAEIVIGDVLAPAACATRSSSPPSSKRPTRPN